MAIQDILHLSLASNKWFLNKRPPKWGVFGKLSFRSPLKSDPSCSPGCGLNAWTLEKIAVFPLVSYDDPKWPGSQTLTQGCSEKAVILGGRNGERWKLAMENFSWIIANILRYFWLFLKVSLSRESSFCPKMTEKIYWKISFFCPNFQGA